ncbi:hypothetical protein EVG20_g7593 [Dentipellis fragilis]|uniref:F-box domain-containing protein n=1 Tax=Dentipellis fragilis TaxID=205917 RepID=A0A4Y9YBU3_9AGAM|nr:hypothetical protein EVG20_g7593 [Dentipellis fragilis]
MQPQAATHEAGKQCSGMSATAISDFLPPLELPSQSSLDAGERSAVLNSLLGSDQDITMAISDAAVGASAYWRSAEDRRFVRPSTVDQPHGRSWTDYMTETQKALALEMDAVARVMCSLRTRCNAVTHVNRLPPEVLAHIFGLLQELVPLSDPRTQAETAYEWLQVTYVCRHWRSVVLGCPRLWSRVLLNFGSEWAEESMRRSRMVPVCFRCTLTKKKQIYVTSLLRQHLSRVRNLDVEWDYRDIERDIHCLCSAAPVLEKARLAFGPWLGDGETLPWLPSDLFAHTAPCLSYLGIYYFHFTWSSLNFTRLTHLQVIKFDKTASNAGQQGLWDVIEALSQMPALEILFLHLALPSIPLASPQAVYPHAHLPNLRHLFLWDLVAESAILLQHVALPLTARHDITCILDVANGA